MSAQRRHVARERNERDLTNFIDSLRSLFIQIQQINTRDVESEYLERTRSHLEDAIGSLQLLLANIGQTQDPILQDFKVIIETVSRQSRIILEIIIVLEWQNFRKQRSCIVCLPYCYCARSWTTCTSCST